MGYQIEKWIEANQKKFDCKHPFGIIHPTRTRSSMGGPSSSLRFDQDKLLTSNCVLGVSILYLGE